MSEIKTDKLTGTSTAGVILVTGEGNSTTTNLQQGLAKAWGSLNGTGTIAAKGGFSIASYVDGGTGIYTVSVSSAFDSTNNIAPKVSAGNQASSPGTRIASIAVNSTTAFKSDVRDENGSHQDVEFWYVSAHGDLA